MDRILKLFNISIPIVQAGMVWNSGWKLAQAVSHTGALGVMGAGSMYPAILKEHIEKYKAHCDKPFAVNLPLLYPDIDEHIKTIIHYQVPIVFTSAGNPKKYTTMLKQHNIKVVHVVSSSEFAKKAEDAGVDAVVAEGFEAGGHNGREETTTMVLVPLVKKAVSIPVIAAGGIATGKQMLAALSLGAEAVQIGSRFICSNEASSHSLFKQKIMASKEGDTMLRLKKVVPVRLLHNAFAATIAEAEKRGAHPDELKQLLGKGKAKLGMFEGQIEDGELEVGQVAALIHEIMPAADIVHEIWSECIQTQKEMSKLFNGIVLTLE